MISCIVSVQKKSRVPRRLPSGYAACAQTKSAIQAQSPNRRNLYSPVCLLTRQGVPASFLARAIEQRCSKRCVSLPHKIHHPPPHRQEKSCVSNSLGVPLANRCLLSPSTFLKFHRESSMQNHTSGESVTAKPTQKGGLSPGSNLTRNP